MARDWLVTKMYSAVRLSVIVPTRNSASTLGMTLDALFQQDLPPLEIIVADGRSTDASRDIAARYRARLVDNPALHAAGGRNRGAAIARGDWLAFVDSDCQPPPRWLATASDLISAEPDLVGIGGPVMPLPPRNQIEQVAGEALLAGVLRFPTLASRPEGRPLRGAFITANVFYRRDAFWSAGGFDERFANYGEDIDLFWRMLVHFPSRLQYEPRLVLEHRFPNSWGSLFTKWFQYGMASCYLQRYHLGRFHIDLAHYRRLGNALAAFVIQRDQRPRQAARAVQLFGHLVGKYVGSVRLRVVDL